MKITINHIATSLTCGILLAACGGGDTSNSASQSQLLADGEACNEAWVDTTEYNGGRLVSYAGRNYSAAYWTKNDNPSTRSGVAFSGQPWIIGFACGGTATTAATTTTTAAATTSTATATTTTAAATTTTTASSSCAAYVAGTTYVANQVVTNIGKYYRCDVAGWCSSTASSYYAPGTGTASTSAWTEVSACSGGATTTTAAATTTTAAGTTSTAAGTTTTSGTTTTTLTTTLTKGVKADQTKRVFTGYYPSWSDNWFTAINWDGTAKSLDQIFTESKLAQVPAQYSHVQLSFANPNFAWAGITADSWAGTGASFNGKPSDIKMAIKVLHARNIKVLLAVGGATYNDWAPLANEAGVANGPIKTALANFLKDMEIDGMDVDYEIGGADSATVTEYANAIQALREAVDLAGNGAILTLAGWSTGADCTAATSSDTGCAGKVSYWEGSAGRERLTFKKLAHGGSHDGQTIGSLLDVVSIMSYDAQTLHYDPVVAYNHYRSLLGAGTIVSLGLETAAEGWAGGMLVINNADATCAGSFISADQYGNLNPGAYSVERAGATVKASSVNARDGLMLWHILKGGSHPCGSGVTGTPATIGAKVGTMFSLPADAYPY